MLTRLLALTLLLLPLRLDAGQNVWTPIGPEGGLVTALAVASKGRTVYAGTPAGDVFRSINTGRSWFQVDAGLSGRVMDLEVAAMAPQVVYAATWEGLFQSRNAGASWTDLTPRLPGIGGETVALLVVTSPIEPGAVYAGIVDGSLFRSLDAGATWERTAGGLPQSVQAVAPHPRQPGVVFAGTTDRIYRSSDSGRTWRRSGLAGYDVVQIAFDPLRPERLCAVRSIDGERLPDARCEIYVSEQGGRRWQKVGAGVESGRNPKLVADPFSPGTAYLSVENSAGATWSRIAFPSATTLSLTDLQVDPGDPETLYGLLHQARPIKSTNGGADWAPLPYDQNQQANVLAVVPGPPTTLYANGMAAIFGGLSYEDRVNRSTSGGATWTPLLTVRDTFFTDLAADPRLPGRILASSVLTLSRIRFPVAGGVYLSTDDGLHWNRFPAAPQTLPPLFSGALEPRDPLRVYAGATGAVFLSEDGGVTWTDTGAGLPPADVVDLQVDPDAPDTVYAATFGGSVYAFTHVSGH